MANDQPGGYTYQEFLGEKSFLFMALPLSLLIAAVFMALRVADEVKHSCAQGLLSSQMKHSGHSLRNLYRRLKDQICGGEKSLWSFFR